MEMEQSPHTGQAWHAVRYACPVCPARFPSVNEKKAHIRTEHPRERRNARRAR